MDAPTSNSNINNNNYILNQTSFVYYTTAPHANMSHAAALAPNIISQTLLPAAATKATLIAAETSSAAVINANATSINTTFGVAVDDANEEKWAHFYDLMLSWQGMCLITLFCILIVITVFGNTLVILAIITTRRLRTVTNCFVMSLAVADLLVGIFVMPPAVAVHLIGSWRLGWVLCDIWISLDVLLCTASILSLCAISVDRYFAVTKPLKYSRKRRSKRLALLMILIVWVVALAITCPPMLGWYEPGRRDLHECRYNQNKGYVIYSAMGSFFLPMVVMIYVYARISCVIASRHDKMTNISVHNKKFKRYTSTDPDIDIEPDFFEHDYRHSNDRRFSNQTIVNELHEVMLPDVENGHPLLGLPASNGKSNCYELTRPVTWRLSITQFTSNARRQQHTQSCPPGSIATPMHSTRSSQQHANQQHFRSLANCIISLKKEHKTTQTLSIVVGGFIACWLPFFIYYLLTPFLEPQQVSRTLTNVLTWLGWFNSAINPFIYAFYSIDFRVAFWRLICRRVCSSARRPQTPTNTMSMRL